MWGLLCCLLHFEISFGGTLVQLAFAAVQHGGDNLIHVVILILTQASAEDDLRLGVGQLLVLGIQCAVFGIVDGVIRLVTGLPLGGILTADDRFGQSLPFSSLPNSNHLCSMIRVHGVSRSV